MADQAKDSEQDSDTEQKQSGAGAVTPSNRLLYGEELLTPRLAAEREIVVSIQGAGKTVRRILGAESFASMADAIALKTQASLAQWVLESANNIGAANGGKQPMQLPAAGVQAGSLQMLLAQRLADKRNQSRVVQRKVIEVVQPIAAEPNAADGVEADGGKPKADAADGGESI